MLLPLLWAFFAAATLQSASSITSDTKLTLDGGPFHNETVALTTATGDWYVTASDAHVTLALHSGAGPRQVALQAEWEGTQARHDLTNDTDPKAPRMQFVLTLEHGRTENGTVWRPTNRATTMTVTVDSVTEHDLVAHVDGALEAIGDGPAIHVTGTIALHRAAAPPAASTGTYGNCDPVIHDRLRGAEDRSPSECEVKLDADVRAAAHLALQRVITTLESAHWQIEEKSEPLSEVPRATEKTPFRATDYSLSFTLDPSAEEGQKLQAQVQARLSSLPPSIMSDPAAQARIQAEIEGIADALKGRVDVRLNVAQAGLDNARATHAPVTVPGSAYAFRSTGAETVTLIYLGKPWGAARFEPIPDGERFSMPFTFDRARSTVSVQNVEIAIRAAAPTADRILQTIDLAPLQALLSK